MSTVKTNQLVNPVVARYVRIHPTAWERDICLRTEFYGCPGEVYQQQTTVSHRLSHLWFSNRKGTKVLSFCMGERGPETLENNTPPPLVQSTDDHMMILRSSGIILLKPTAGSYQKTCLKSHHIFSETFKIILWSTVSLLFFL